MIRTLRNYWWFIKESQFFMKGVYNPVIIFILSLWKGIGFCVEMNKYYKYMEEKNNECK